MTDSEHYILSREVAFQSTFLITLFIKTNAAKIVRLFWALPLIICYIIPSQSIKDASSSLFIHSMYSCSQYPSCCCWLIWPMQDDAKHLKDDWNHGTWVLIWEFSGRAILWIPTWQGYDGFQQSLHPCALDESGRRIGRVKSISVPWVCS